MMTEVELERNRDILLFLETARDAKDLEHEDVISFLRDGGAILEIYERDGKFALELCVEDDDENHQYPISHDLMYTALCNYRTTGHFGLDISPMGLMKAWVDAEPVSKADIFSLYRHFYVLTEGEDPIVNAANRRPTEMELLRQEIHDLLEENIRLRRTLDVLQKDDISNANRLERRDKHKDELILSQSNEICLLKKLLREQSIGEKPRCCEKSGKDLFPLNKKQNGDFL